MISIQDKQKASDELDKLNQMKEEEIKVLNKEISEIRDKYRDMIDELKQVERKKINDVEQRILLTTEEIDAMKEPHCKVISEYHFIMECLRIKELIDEGDTTLDILVYEFDYPRDEKGEIKHVLEGNCWCYPDKIRIPYEPIDTLFEDKYCKIIVYITKNDRPKNKFALTIVGNSFLHALLKEDFSTYSYRASARTEPTFPNIHFCNAYKPTSEDIQKYYKKTKDTILSDYIKAHKKMQQRYEEIIKATDTLEWEIQFWLDKKDYYENYYNRGAELEEYQVVLKKLKELRGET